jgi:hypothetical protein
MHDPRRARVEQRIVNRKFEGSVLAAAMFLVTGTSALAGRPLQTEDAGVLERAACEIEGMAAQTRSQGVAEREQAPGLGCGLGFGSQIGASVSRSGSGSERAQSAGFGSKTTLWSAGDDGPALVLALGLARDRVGEDTNLNRARWRTAERTAALVATLPAGPGALHLNLSHTEERAAEAPRRRITGWNLAYEHDALPLGRLALAPMAELFGDDRGDAWVNLALRATLVADRLFVDASWGRQLAGPRAERATLATLGFKLAF